jgi:hypothetical protein
MSIYFCTKKNQNSKMVTKIVVWNIVAFSSFCSHRRVQAHFLCRKKKFLFSILILSLHQNTLITKPIENHRK